MIAPVQELSPPRRVLIIKPSALGDVVTGVPILRGLRRTFPKAHIAWLLSTSCAALMQDDKELDEIILFDRRRLGSAWRSVSGSRELVRLLGLLRRGRFDWVIDLQGLLRSGLLGTATLAPLRAGFADAREGSRVFYTHPITVSETHTVDRNIALGRQLGIDVRPDDMVLHVSKEGKDFAEELCRRRDLRKGRFLICVPPTRWATKRYPVRCWREVVASLISHAPVVLLGAPDDEKLCRSIAESMEPGVINLTGGTSIAQMVGVIAPSAGVICCDSAAKFIATGVGVDVVTLIGPTRVERTGPYRSGRSIVSDVPCQGCLKRRCRHNTCMELIDPAVVASAALEMLHGRGG